MMNDPSPASQGEYERLQKRGRRCWWLLLAGPDVLALDRGWHLLYVASESGILSVFEERGQTVQKVEEGLIAPEAHSVAVDEETHRIFLPLQEVDGRPVLRVARFCSLRHAAAGC